MAHTPSTLASYFPNELRIPLLPILSIAAVFLASAGLIVLQMDHPIYGAAVFSAAGTCFGLVLWKPKLGFGLILFLLPLMSFNVQSHLLGKPVNFEKLSFLILGIGWIAYKIRTRNFQIQLPKSLLIIWSAYLLSFMTAGIYYVISGGSLFSQVWYFAERVSHFLIFLVAWDLLSSPDNRNHAAKILLASFSVILVMLTLEWISVYLTNAYLLNEKFRFYFSDVTKVTYAGAVGTFEHPNMMAAYLVLISPLIYFSWESGERNSWVRHIAALPVVALVILSSSQSALIGLLLTGLIVFGILYRQKLPVSLFVAAAVLATGIIWTGIGELRTGINVRLYTWGISTEIIGEKPLIGHGLGQSPDTFLRAENLRYRRGEKLAAWRIQERAKGHGQTMHSSYLTASVEAGLLGGIVFALLIGTILFRTACILRRRNYNMIPMAMCLAGMVGFAAHAFTEDLFAYSKLATIFFTVAALCIRLSEDKLSSGSEAAHQ